ncbi:MAG TPA: GNAT family N-acetyltransferase [Spirochaetia bacterium]|nr:GNAT family N-acetyltransferase [Spirochaetia bacterium]
MKNDTRDVAFIEGYAPGIIGRVVELHGRYYSHEWGVGAEFESLMAREICDFVDHYDPDRELLLSAAVRGSVVGSIAILRPDVEEDAARLRWFVLDPAYQGHGIGSEMLLRALLFARERYRTCYLWTVAGLPASMHLYEKLGFTVVQHETDKRYGAELKSVRMVLDLQRANALAE